MMISNETNGTRKINIIYHLYNIIPMAIIIIKLYNNITKYDQKNKIKKVLLIVRK